MWEYKTKVITIGFSSEKKIQEKSDELLNVMVKQGYELDNFSCTNAVMVYVFKRQLLG